MRWLRLPDQYLLTSIGDYTGLDPFLEKLETALHKGVKLVQFREPAWAVAGSPDDVYTAFLQVAQRCHDAGARCLVNSCHPEEWWRQADGVHFRTDDAGSAAAQAYASAKNASTAKPSDQTAAPANTSTSSVYLIGVSAHTASDLAAAQALDADFVVLGHVLATPSHPDAAGMGWERFSDLAAQAGRPVFAIGGQSPRTITTARQYGAHGIAGIRFPVE